MPASDRRCAPQTFKHRAPNAETSAIVAVEQRRPELDYVDKNDETGYYEYNIDDIKALLIYDIKETLFYK